MAIYLIIRRYKRSFEVLIAIEKRSDFWYIYKDGGLYNY